MKLLILVYILMGLVACTHKRPKQAIFDRGPASSTLRAKSSCAGVMNQLLDSSIGQDFDRFYLEEKFNIPSRKIDELLDEGLYQTHVFHGKTPEVSERSAYILAFIQKQNPHFGKDRILKKYKFLSSFCGLK